MSQSLCHTAGLCLVQLEENFRTTLAVEVEINTYITEKLQS